MKNAPSTNLPHRRHERIVYENQASLVFSNGHVCAGTTRDVSLHGLFFTPLQASAEIRVGQEGTIQLFLLGKRKEFKCRIAHLSSKGIGIELIDRGITFGAELTDSLMGESLFRLGVDLSATAGIQVTGRWVHATTSHGIHQARLIRIGMGYLELSLPAFSPTHPEKEDLLELQITRPNHPPITVEGVVRSVATHATETIHMIAFTEVPERTSNEIRSLIQHQIDIRLHGMQTNQPIRTTNHPDFSPKHTVRQLWKEFEGVFGK